jgi:hypothetical protein
MILNLFGIAQHELASRHFFGGLISLAKLRIKWFELELRISVNKDWSGIAKLLE